MSSQPTAVELVDHRLLLIASSLIASADFTTDRIAILDDDAGEVKHITSAGLASRPTKTITNADSPYTMLAGDYMILADATSGAITVNLIAIGSAAGRERIIKKIDSSANMVTVDGNGTTIDDNTTSSLAAQYDTLRVQPDGSEWWIV